MLKALFQLLLFYLLDSQFQNRLKIDLQMFLLFTSPGALKDTKQPKENAAQNQPTPFKSGSKCVHIKRSNMILS